MKTLPRDYAMCDNSTCHLSKQCLRHKDSGTVSKTPEYQPYADFKQVDGKCDYFINGE
jgi:hypothetical protein